MAPGEVRMDKVEHTKLEVLKDLATAVAGQRALCSDLASRCESLFGMDFGLNGVVTGLLLAHNDMKVQIGRME